MYLFQQTHLYLVHRHTGGLEMDKHESRIRALVHRHTGGLEMI